jgi:hypothetical protein
MSDNDNDENAIQNKTNNNQGSNTLINNLKNFSFTLFSNLLTLIILFILGALVLFGCKVGQSNVLFTDINYLPYTDKIPTIESIDTNVFISYNPSSSMKLNIPYKNEALNINNSTQILLDLLRSEKNVTKSSLINYLISLIYGMFSFNYSSISTVFQIMNYLPEFLILIIGPIIFFIASIILLIVNYFYFIYLWFHELGWFFDEKEEFGILNFSWGWNIARFVLIVILFIIILIALICFVVPIPAIIFFIFMWVIISVFTFTGVINDKVVGAGQFIIDVFKYYKVSFMSITSFLLLINAFSNLGIVAGVFVLVVMILIIFNIIHLDIYKPALPENSSPLSSTKKAEKQTIDDTSSQQTGGGKGRFFKNLFDDPTAMIKQLKKMNKLHKKY